MVQAGETMVYELRVGMTCDGCSGAIDRILGAKPGKFLHFNVTSLLIYLPYICAEISSV